MATSDARKTLAERNQILRQEYGRLKEKKEDLDEHITTIDGILCVNPGSPTFPHNLEVQFGTIGYLDIDDGGPSASIWRLNEQGIEPFDWDTWGRPW